MFVFRQDEFKESKIAIEKLSKLGLHTIGKNIQNYLAQKFITQKNS